MSDIIAKDEKVASFDIKELKKEALVKLRNSWAEVAFITLFYVASPIIAYMTIIMVAYLTGGNVVYVGIPFVIPPYNTVFVVSSVAIVIASYLLSCPLYLGTSWYYLQLANGNVMPVSSIFARYNTKSSIMLSIKIKLKIDIKKAIVLIPTAIVMCAVFSLASTIEDDFTRHLIDGVAIAVFLILYVYFFIKYTPIGFIITNDYDNSEDLICNYKNVSTKHLKQLVKMFLSFMPYFVASITMFPLLFVIPYLSMNSALYTNEYILRGRDE